MIFSNRLQTETQNQRQEFLSIPVLQNGIAGNISLETYTAFLTQTYHHAKHSVPLLLACGNKLPKRLEWLRAAIGNYITEEARYESLILNDINACGFDAESTRNKIPNNATDILVDTAYDIIYRLNPVGLFGMILVLQGTRFAYASQTAKAIKVNLKLPDSAFTYMMSHNSRDIFHMHTFESLINKLEDLDDQQAVINTANLMYTLYGQVLKNLPHPD